MQTLAVAAGSETLKYSFDNDFGELAPGWWINWWGSVNPQYRASRESRPGYVFSGASAQQFALDSIASDGAAHLVYSYDFAKDTNYSISIKVKADTSAKVRFEFRRQGFPYNEVASKVVDVQAGWQAVTLDGIYPWSDPGTVRVVPLTYGTSIYLDEMVIAKAPAPTVVDAVAVTESSRAVAVTELPAQGNSAVSLDKVMHSTMDEPFTRFENGWFFNAWDGADGSSFVASRESRPDHVYAGTGSQKFEVIDKKGGEVHLIAGYKFAKGKTYRVSMFVRADQPTPIWAALRMDAHPWQPVAASQVVVGRDWQKVEFEGTYDTDAPGTVRISILNPTGTVWVDEMVISEVTRNDMAPVSTAAVPDTLFGMHVNKFGRHWNWPGLGTKIVRLWDSGVTWRDLKPTAGAWDFTKDGGQRLDMFVGYIRDSEPGADILYTLGQTPQWASSTPTVSGLYGPGASGAPKNMDDWRDYVRTLARRYVGKIRYWELWNEPDYALNYSGSMASMVEMARIARQELLAVDPGNKLVGPGFTTDQGMTGLENFFGAGGGSYIDMVGFHWYYATNPESIAPGIDNVRNVMKAYGLGDKPLWNTEGAFICNPAVADCASARPTVDESLSVNARALFVMAAKGIQNFNFYFWETAESFGKLVEADFRTPTPAALALSEARAWIRGARIVDAYRIDNKIYVLRLTRGTESFVILWSTQANAVVGVPAAWNVKTAHDLSRVRTTIPATGQLVLGLNPLMLRQ